VFKTEPEAPAPGEKSAPKSPFIRGIIATGLIPLQYRHGAAPQNAQGLKPEALSIDTKEKRELIAALFSLTPNESSAGMNVPAGFHKAMHYCFGTSEPSAAVPFLTRHASRMEHAFTG